MPWLSRGLTNGVVTTRYPRRNDDYGKTFKAAVSVRVHETKPDHDVIANCIDLCPTGAISSTDQGSLQLDRGSCIVCGFCVQSFPEFFEFSHLLELAASSKKQLMMPYIEESAENIKAIRSELAERVRSLKRSVHIRHIDAGSDGSEEWEINALLNPIYDVNRLGIYFSASPRHADIALVSGVGTLGMQSALEDTLEAMPEPKVVIAVGTDAIAGGLVHPSYSTYAGIGTSLPVDIWVPGSPPSPFTILHAILLAIGKDNGTR